MMDTPSQPLIGGSTRLFAIIGDPIGQVKSPTTFNPRFAAAGLDAVLIPVHVRPERFDETVSGLMAVGNLDGIIVTVPYKARIVPFIDHLLPTADHCRRRQRAALRTGRQPGPATCSTAPA